jgi:Ca-activated chloride channel homolog
MRFAYPQIIWLAALLLPALGAFLIYSWRKKQQLIGQFVQSRLLASLTVGVSQGRQKLKLWLLFLAMVMAFIALARPQWGFDWEEVHQQGIDIVVAIDTSKSMLAQDVVPNRLARARLAVFDLMKLAQSDRLGLIAFAGTAFLQCPLTVDDGAFRQSVEALDANIIPQGGSAISEAIDSAITAFEKSGDNHKVLVLFTDGEDHDSGAVVAAEKAAKAGIKIFTIGVGTPDGEMLRVLDEQGHEVFLKDNEGNAIRSRLNETLLRQVATSAGGFYLPLLGSNPMEVLYSKGLDVLPKAESTTKLIKNFRERYHWPLGLAILLLVVEFLLPDRRRSGRGEAKRKAVGAVETAGVAILLLLLTPVAMLGSTGSAQKSYELGKFKDSLADYEKLLARKTNDFRLNFNAGTAAYKARELARARKHFESTLGSPDLALQERAYYNLGNTMFQAGEATQEAEERQNAWETAIKNYEGALKLKPDDADAKNNLEFVRKKLEELKEEQSKQQSDKNQDDKNKDKDDKEKKDEKKQDQQQSKSDEQKKKEQEEQQQKNSQQNKDQQKQDQQQQQDAKEDQAKPSEEEKKKQDAAKDDGKEKPPEQEPSEGSPGTVNGQMTMEQAMQFLEAQKQQEKTLIFMPPPDQKARGKKLKDW